MQLDDPARLSAARAFREAGLEPRLQHLCDYARDVLRCDAAAVTVVMDDVQHILVGSGVEPQDTLATASVCQHVVEGERTMTFISAMDDIPTVADDIMVRGYMGTPVQMDGQIVGAFCVWQRTPRQWWPDEVAFMEQIAQLAMSAIILERIYE